MKNNIKKIIKSFKLYIKKLLFPLYLFPIKLLTYSTYYFLKLLWKIISWPFRKWGNLGKTLLWMFISIYILLSFVVIMDYLNREYGSYKKFLCGYQVKEKLKSSVIRIIGGFGEGSGFFISPTEVVTNFHVIADEPSPKIVFPDGTFETPVKIVGDSNMDIAVLTLKNEYPQKVYELPSSMTFYDNEPLLSAGYPLGSEVTGDVTIVRGNFIDYRRSRKDYIGYLQTNISLVSGMSGGPLVDQCGQVVGINTQSLAGISFFITASDVNDNLVNLTDQEIEKIDVDSTKSPEDAVYAFYTYLKARRMEAGYKLLSNKYLEKTNYTEWTNRFTDILNVDIFISEPFEKSKTVVFVKFGTTNWVDGEAEYHYYEGTWETVNEEGTYKMNKSKIIEVSEPDYNWFYE
ncbi:hypothetical protein A2422_01390 [Candidatus Woesebacteria bacterium RIFOXYC1_FULL_31_51]|uniref:Periplasmic serine protease, Do/DeqQ family n=1 Tax=Candidatus Woesebacteria bacterium GW2011_GWC2_31_9 TaxID=1618586 RepID=A0A0F9YJ65_9BACT|nr:MAG: S1C family peptidase [Candidatus Woesebacteria bacterium GW2011_GWF1_31_35]KKP25954.1 MAG: Periplasmic serine protease, Do/DeqQ family [Candidatus Woesebacteria bacterium GW2011_GWD1_31_12]KKP27180.1 MAG: Periplasmic serine protease, Do/DeqQ family [Candidatus Woesebacteria bacterium GW2011_GWB1_31_29]KKP31559.1 MAG: Periplasmic serine protease, Do/DeqQ family [Candidatus Woesebacteria bacterium GW2011_GWC2_31_9]KKP33971.1 MAG: Periplasmic serine protease, Do/DeqQ family [Candidatus Woe